MTGSCQHGGDFDARVSVARLSDTGGYQADVTVWCRECSRPFVFLGLSSGLDLRGARVSPDGTEARIAIRPKGEPAPSLEGVRGFDISERRPCGQCSGCDERLFRGWAARLRAGLGEDTGDGSPRHALATEVAADIGRRHPFGIAAVLGGVLQDLILPAADEQAAYVFDSLADDERAARKLNLGDETPGDCLDVPI